MKIVIRCLWHLFALYYILRDSTSTADQLTPNYEWLSRLRRCCMSSVGEMGTVSSAFGIHLKTQNEFECG